MIVSALVGMVGCVRVDGAVPTIAAADPARGTKLLKPNVCATTCESGWIWDTPESMDLAGRALRQLLALDDEATAVDNARLTATGWSVGLYRRGCMTVAGDLVRSVSTVMLPMPGHAAHGEHPSHPGGND